MRTVEVEINVTKYIELPEAWDLYVRKDCKEASKALDKAVIEACTYLLQNERASIHEAMVRHVYPVMDKYADVGAYDTEPREQAVYCLEKFGKGIRGTEGTLNHVFVINGYKIGDE